MFDDLAAYFYENVVASFEEYISTMKSKTSGKSRDLRTAVNAASALFHLREHLPESNQLSHSEVELLCPDYKIIGNIANSAKHKEIDRQNPLISKASQLEEVTFITLYADEQGEYRFIEKEVTAKLDDGTTRRVSDLLINVMNFWQSHLHSIGIVKTPQSYQLNSTNQPVPRDQAGDGQLCIEIIRGVRYTNSLCLQKYNYEKGIIEPIDLTGATVVSRIYKTNPEIE